MPGRVLKWVGITLFIGTAIGMSLYLTQTTPDTADKRASVVGAFIALASLALTLYGMRADRRSGPAPASVVSDDTIAAAKKTLAVLVAQQWRTEATIRSLGDPEPIPIVWHLVDDPGLMDHPRLIGKQLLTFTARGDQIPQLVHHFRQLRRRRLVITGGPGTGKTTLAIQLLLQLSGPAGDSADPVPVLVPVNGWDTTAHPRLHDWLATRLARDYPALTAPQFGPAAAKALLDHGHILPILDGLDEIPHQARTAVMSALNRWLADSDQFILTSRTSEFATAVDQAGDVLTAAAVITPAPITPATAERYLRTCLPPVPRHNWTPVWTALRNASRPGLSALTETALGLWLIRTVYITAVTHPTPLTGPLAEQETTLRAHLLDHLVTAAVHNRPPSTDRAEHFRPRRTWDPVQARDYLAYLARLLTDQHTRDLVWWHLAGHVIPDPAQRRAMARRAQLAVLFLASVAGVLAYGLAGMPTVGFRAMVEGYTWTDASGRVIFGADFGAAPWLLSGLVPGFVAGLAAQRWVIRAWGHVDSRLRRKTAQLITRHRASLRIGLLITLVVGFAYGIGSFSLPLVTLLVFGLVFGLVLGLVCGFATQQWFTQTPGYADLRLYGRTADLIKHLRSSLSIGLMVGLVIGLVYGFTLELAIEFAGDLVTGLLVGALLGAVAGLVFGLAFGLIAWAEQPASTTTATTPLSSWKADRRLTVLRTVTFGLVFGLAVYSTFLLGVGLGLESVAGLAMGVMLGVVGGLTVGDHHAWLAYQITAWRLARARRTPRALMAFLDDAHRLGLLRTVGPVYQFRHADLQDHLAALPRLGNASATATT
ncbi:NACHT domain-containing protein [Sphaerisporangium sp. NPDC005289]|uniref:NACHT domain-containing protein n=1 Tax=Sphaerisporangium sp. NPDC005289 TaxID=3155247 RepID=UPI0033B41CEC